MATKKKTPPKAPKKPTSEPSIFDPFIAGMLFGSFLTLFRPRPGPFMPGPFDLGKLPKIKRPKVKRPKLKSRRTK